MFGSQWQNGHNRPIIASGAYAAEITKWEAQHTQFGPPGRPYEYRPFPAMLYKARRPGHGEHGEYCRAIVNESEVGNLILEHVIADTEVEAQSQERLGFVLGGPLAAIEALVKLETFVATAAAERADQDRHMSPKAQADAAAKDGRTIQHLGEIPAEPLPPKRK